MFAKFFTAEYGTATPWEEDIDIYIYLIIYCNWVSTLWQWSVDLCKNRKETAQKEKQYTKLYKNNTKTQNTQNRQQKYNTKNKHKKEYKHKR